MSKSDKPKTSLRKSPKQGRSKDLVDSVMQATARILEASGVDGVTTNKVAEMAGVSIGSLYQYFPGKDAIFSILIERQLEATAERLRKLMEANQGVGVSRGIEIIVSDVVDSLYERRSVISSLSSEIPKLKKTREILYRRNKTIQIFMEYLHRHEGSLRDPAHVEEQVYVLAHGIVGVMQSAVQENFETYSPQVIKGHLTEMARAFLLKP